MNRQEAGGVLALMTAAWPNQKITEQTARVWMDMLANVNPDDGLVTARRLIASEEWFPPITKFLEHSQAVARERCIRETPSLPAGRQNYVPCPPELMAKMRDCLKNAKAL